MARFRGHAEKQDILFYFGEQRADSVAKTRGQNKTRVMNGPLQFLTASKIFPLLDLLAKFKRVLACSCSPNFCSCSHARFLVSIARNFVNPSLG